ncbi:MAG: hypothetical protein ACM3X1_07660 [Ignavibacteriales bacterium]
MMTSSTTIEEKQQISDSGIRKVLTTKKYFMICESCWCASSYAFFNEEHGIPKSMLHDTVITRYASVQLVELKNRSNHSLFHLMNLTSLIMIQLEGDFGIS